MKHLISGRDYKVMQWVKNSPEQNLVAIKGSRLQFGIKVIKQTFFSKASELTVIQRYLNDYPSYFKSLLLVISDIFYINYLRLRGIELWWLCHNIDKESHNNYPRIIQYRRHLVLNYATNVLVTDPLLEKYARLLFRKYNINVKSVCFGPYDHDLSIHAYPKQATVPIGDVLSYESIGASELFKILRQQKTPMNYIGYCAGGTLAKKKYLQFLPNLIKKSIEQELDLTVLVISNLKRPMDTVLYDYLVSSPHIVFVNSLMDIDLLELASHIDFYWTGYNDISIPYSIHAASTTHVPTISLDMGVIPLILKNYQIGFTVKNDLSNLTEVFKHMNQDKFGFAEFTATHQWNSFEKLLATKT
jgi:hypothetical protein